MFHQTLVAYWVVYLSYLPLWGSAVPLLLIGVLSCKPDWPLRKKVKIENDHKNMIDISNESTLNYIYDIILRYG